MRKGLPIAAPLVAVGLLALSAVDRLGWARLSQWREDQATNLWLGLTRGALDLPVGLVNSVGVPNPNGMALLGIPLARLPGLLAVSFTLGAIQAALVVALCFSLSLRLRERTVLALLLLSSVLLRASSVEFWNQWLVTSVNLAFALSVVRYLRRPSTAWVPLWTALVLLAPSLYLAGLASSVVFAGTAALLLRIHRPSSSPATRTFALVASLLVACASAWVTWVPYLRAVGVEGALGAAPMPLLSRIDGAVDSLLRSPLWWPAAWVGPSAFVILQSSPEILSRLAVRALRVADGLLLAQHVLVVGACLAWMWQWRRGRTRGDDRARSPMDPALRELAWLGGIAAAAYAVTPALGGPTWVRHQRLDIALPWLPLLLVTWFGAALVIPLRPGARAVRAITLGIALALVAAGLVLGHAVQDSYLTYRGPVLVPADVPLRDKLAVVDFLAADWRDRGGGGAIPVDYDLGGGTWDWVPEFGRKLERWYPAPMTLGRAFDHELLRRHGLSNAQEGRARAAPGGGRYVVGYLALPPTPIAGHATREIPIGRLRVTVVDP